MRQAIQTKFMGPTNYRPARVKAWADAGSVVVSWDHALGVEGNHCAAAATLCKKLGWPVALLGGSLPGSGYVFVQA